MKCNSIVYYKLNQVVLINKFKQPQANELEKMIDINGKFPLLPSSRNYDWFTTLDKAKKWLCNGNVITLGRARNPNIKKCEGYFVSSNNIIIQSFDEKILSYKYLYYFLDNIKESFYVESASYPKFDKNIFDQTKIPIPSMKEQNKIVEILDKFTNYKAELTAELTFREAQYKYYRDKLLNNLDCVEYKPLLDISLNIFSGGTPQTSKKEYYNGDISWLRSGEIKFGPINKTEIKITKLGLNNSSAKLIRPHSIVIALTGATVARVGWTEIETSSNQSVCAIEINPNVNYKFVYYFLESQYNNLKSKSKGALSSLTNNFIKNYQIPIPSIEVQNKIVEILDKFNSLINNISEGIPKEIQLRDKQYNYYRNLLLDFEDK